MFKYVNCNLCGADDTVVVQRAEPPYNVVRCKKCGLVYVNPQPDRRSVEAHYQEDYYRHWLEDQLPQRILMWKKRLAGMKRYRSRGRFLDVGCGLGTFLKVAREDGFEVLGTEISEWAAPFIRKTYGINVFQGTLEEAGFPSAGFDVVTLWHSLEHMPNPKETLREAHRILKDGGLLVVACPNLNNFIVRILYLLVKRKRLKFFSCHAKELHLYHFSPGTLGLMLQETGFKLLETELDLAQIDFRENLVDFLTFVFHLLTRKNFGEAFKIYVVKKS